jgi:hypothetical protein
VKFWCSQCKVDHAGDCPPASKLVSPTAWDDVAFELDRMNIEDLKKVYLMVKDRLLSRMSP